MRLFGIEIKKASKRHKFSDSDRDNSYTNRSLKSAISQKHELNKLLSEELELREQMKDEVWDEFQAWQEEHNGNPDNAILLKFLEKIVPGDPKPLVAESVDIKEKMIPISKIYAIAKQLGYPKEKVEILLKHYKLL